MIVRNKNKTNISNKTRFVNARKECKKKLQGIPETCYLKMIL